MGRPRRTPPSQTRGTSTTGTHRCKFSRTVALSRHSYGLRGRHPDRLRLLVAHEPPAFKLQAGSDELFAEQQAIYDTYRAHGIAPAMGRFAKMIKPNLGAALRALRHNNRPRYLWIDAICIDQDHIREKNHQVDMMSEIYGRAKNVCIWLGEASEASEKALRFIKHEVLRLRNFDNLCDNKENSPKWLALLELMQREWFSRRWVGFQ